MKKNIAIVGATGKREDHTLGNISLLIDYMRTGAHVRMLTDYGIFIPCHDTCSFPSQPGQQISIINFGAHNLRGKGLVYPLSDFTNWWQGTLNESTETEHSRRRGIFGSDKLLVHFLLSATSTKYTLRHIIPIATPCSQVKRSCPTI